LASSAPSSRLLDFISLLALAAVLLASLSALTTVDPDVFHEMALWRAALEGGRVPDRDLFAYTPTISPCVHHEWATGMVLYSVAMTAGESGVMALKYLLVLIICGLCLLCAHRRGADMATLTICSLLAIGLARIGFTTIRAQVFTLAALALLLLLLDLDRQGRRGLLWLWLPVHVAWLNLHGGFVVGLGVLGVHCVEQVVRHRNAQWHLLLLGAAMIAAVFLNPYGLTYFPYLWQAVTMPRPRITEWAPLWDDPDVGQLLVYALSMAAVVYAVVAIGPRRLPGLAIVLVCALLALRHTRHLSLYAVAWWCYVPGFLSETPLAARLSAFWDARRRFVGILLLVLTAACLAAALPRQPWRMSIPVSAAGPTQGKLIYPVGAVRYLQEQNFHGNVLTPFTEGAYVSWHLYPAVKVSLDSRYEVAYQRGLLEEMVAFYQGGEGWGQPLARYPTDAVLVRRTEPVVGLLPGLAGWVRVYQDDAFEVSARKELHLPVVDRTGETLFGSFP